MRPAGVVELDVSASVEILVVEPCVAVWRAE